MSARLLIVEDEGDLSEVFQEYFQMKGLVVFVAKTGEAALTQLQQNNLDIVLLDVLLKGEMSGIDVLKEIKSSYPKLKTVMLTGSDIPAHEKESLALGVNRFLRKPVTISKLYEHIMEVLSGK